MNITIVGRKCTPRQSFKDRAEQKLKKVERFFGENAEAKITATVEKSAKIVEITLNKGGMIFRAQERSADLEDALDACVDSLIRQIRKNKTKLEIVRKKAVILKPESVEEAILQMNMLGHQFYLFNNSEDDTVSVVYRRKDGGYGLLSPEKD